MSYTIVNKNNIEYLKTQPDDCFDSIVTDPPYGIEFLAKDWDSNTGALETWQECLRTLKPGGYILAFSAARTYHQLATNIEQAGFEIRDQLMWIYASGFPKAQDIGKAIQRRQGVEKSKPQDGTNAFKKDGGMSFGHDGKFGDKKAEVIPTSPEAEQWSGWKTALKPAHEPIVMARKPFKGSTIDNVLKHGTGALNIDASRITTDELKPAKIGRDPRNNLKSNGVESDIPYTEAEWIPNEQGRYPANVLGDIPDYQKYFYCPKVSRRERHCGFEQDPISHLDMVTEMGGYYVDEKGNKDESRSGGGNMIWLPHLGKIYTHGLKHEYEEWCKKNNDPLAHNKRPAVGNNHPTVKPVALMRYLIQLVTPKGGRVLDPFCGSGSTGMAAVELGHEFVGCDLDPNYVDISNRRIAGWLKTNGEPAEPNLPRMCGPGGSEWVQSLSYQGNNPSTYKEIFEEK